MGKIIGESFADYVDKQVEIRQKKIGARQRDNETHTYLTGKTPWIRLTSGVDVDEFKCKELGIDFESFGGNQLAKKYILFNGTSTDNTTTNNTIIKGGLISSYSNTIASNKAYGFNSSADYGMVPPPGIESITVTPKNRGSLRIAEINIKCFNRDQFEIIETLFMRLKYTILLEWGHSIYFDNEGNLQQNPISNTHTAFLNTLIPKYPPDFTGPIPDTEPAPEDNQRKILDLIDLNRERNDGNYDGFLGWVTNFSWKLSPENNTYDIQVKAVSYGDVIESLSATKPAPFIYENTEEEVASPPPLVYILETFKKLLDKDISFEEYHDIVKTSPPISDLVRKTGNYIDGIDIPTSKIAEIIKFKTPFYTPPEEFLVGKEFLKLRSKYNYFSKNDYNYYIKLGTLLRIIQNFLYIYNDENPSSIVPINTFDCDYNTNICSQPYINISNDPKICLIPSGFKWEDEKSSTVLPFKLNELLGQTLSPPYSYIVTTTKAKHLHIHVNIDYIINLVIEKTKNGNDISYYDIITSILSGINNALNNLVDLTLSQDPDTNIFYILDSNPPKTFEPLDIKVEPPTKILIGLLPNEQGSFAKNVSIDSQISNNLATQLAIGAQANNSSLGSDSVAFSNWNRGLTDRIIPFKRYTTPTLASITADNGKEKELEREYNNIYWFLTNLNVLELSDQQVINGKTSISNYLKIKRDELVKEGQLLSTSFIPISLNIELDGIAGIKIYQKYSVNDEYLPKNYRDNIEFITKGLTHKVDPSGWTTTIDGLSIPKQSDVAPTGSQNPPPSADDAPSTPPPSTEEGSGDTPNADRLRNVLTQLGYTEKGDEISNGGDITEGMADYAIAVFRQIKSQYPTIQIRVTGGNDKYHQNLPYTSAHSEGNGLDFTITPNTDTDIANIDLLLQGFAAGNRERIASFINEYENATRAATGKHFHLRIGGRDASGFAKIENAYAAADRGELTTYPIT